MLLKPYVTFSHHSRQQSSCRQQWHCKIILAFTLCKKLQRVVVMLARLQILMCVQQPRPHPLLPPPPLSLTLARFSAPQPFWQPICIKRLFGCKVKLPDQVCHDVGEQAGWRCISCAAGCSAGECSLHASQPRPAAAGASCSSP